MSPAAEQDRLSDRPPESNSDEVLVSRLRAGDVASFEILMRRYNQRLYRIARSMVHSDSDAEDVVQQAYLSAYSNLEKFQGNARFGTWLTRIAINEALGRIRSGRRMQPLGDGLDADQGLGPSREPNPEDQAAMKQMRDLLEKAILSLPETYRVAFVLRDVEGLDTAEAAACLDVSEEALRVRLFRARAMLRDTLCTEIGTATPDVFAFAGERCDRIVAGVLSRLSEAQQSG
jgi:RNA polymerase sigma-70 factor (ECF subfamily)